MPDAPAATAEAGKPAFWSLQKVVRPAAPVTRNTSWARNDVDRFVLSRLESRELSPSQEADRRTLIRRASYDLIGLPPTAEETRSVCGRQGSRFLGASHRPVAGISALWGAVGKTLARHGSVCGFSERLRERRTAIRVVVYVSRLGHHRVE